MDPIADEHTSQFLSMGYFLSFVPIEQFPYFLISFFPDDIMSME